MATCSTLFLMRQRIADRIPAVGLAPRAFEGRRGACLGDYEPPALATTGSSTASTKLASPFIGMNV
jgi:hypothetical protein